MLEAWETTGTPAGSPPSRETLQRFLDAIDELAAAASDVVENADASAAAQRPRVLISADDAAFAATLERSLSPGHDFEVVPNAELALQSAFTRTPDVLVTSGDSAVDTVRRLREVQPALPAIVAASSGREASRLVSAFANEPVVILQTPGGEAVALAVRALLDVRKFRRTVERAPDKLPADWDATREPRSYSHLAGLVPRALERAVDFDVGAGVIARPGSEPVVDVYAKCDCSQETIDRVREHDLALFKLVAGGSAHVDAVALAGPPAPLRSSVHVPLATQGRVVGLTYLASFQPEAFSSDHERVLAALATYASTGYRNVESSLSRLRLTARQSQVLALVAAGLSDREVGERLGLAHRTVRTHLDRLLREHGFHSRTEAVAAWLRGQHG